MTDIKHVTPIKDELAGDDWLTGQSDSSGLGDMFRFKADVLMPAPLITHGEGSPEAVFTAQVGTLYVRLDDDVATALYVKETGTGDTGWVDLSIMAGTKGDTGETGAKGDKGDTGDPGILTGTGSPESVVTAAVGALYVRTDGGAATTLYVKETGAGDTGWAAK